MNNYSDIEKSIFSLYYDTPPDTVQKIDLCRGDDDFRNIYFTYDGKKRLVIKHASNSFTDKARIHGWEQLITEYNKLGIYCPHILPNKHKELTYQYTKDGRTYYVFAEEFAKYETAEHAGEDKPLDEAERRRLTDDILRSVGKVASAHFDFLPFPSAYCLLEPHSPPDTTDEGTACALLFADYIKKELPQFVPRVGMLMKIYYANQEALRKVYSLLPVSCFQADINDSNVLLDGRTFAGLIDFNLSGKEPVLNYTVRLALLGNNRKRFWSDETLDRNRMTEFMRNMECIEECYSFSPLEREVFPVLLRYINSFWWEHIRELETIKQDDAEINRLLDWLEYQMTRDDIRLP